MRVQSEESTRWLNVALVLAFVLAGLSLGSIGVVHDALHRASITTWQRLARVQRLASPNLAWTVSTEQARLR
jgi:hypothetical protein